MTDILSDNEPSGAATEFWYQPDESGGDATDRGRNPVGEEDMVGTDGSPVEPLDGIGDPRSVPPVSELENPGQPAAERPKTEDSHLSRSVPDVTPAQSPLSGIKEHDPDRWEQIEVEAHGRQLAGSRTDDAPSGSRTKYIVTAVIMVLAALALMYFLAFGSSDSNSNEPGVRQPDTAVVGEP